MKKMIFGAVAAVAISGVATAQDSIAYWSQNSNDLPGGGFGYEVGDFPQGADFGVQAGTATIQPSDGMLANVNAGVYVNLQSFSGTSENAQFGEASGGSLSVVGDAVNGQWIDFVFDASSYMDLVLTWAQRGTSTGFSSRSVSVSADGQNFTEIYSNSGALTSSWTVETADAGSLLDGASTAIFRFTFDGATSTNGNNRLDNILIQGSTIPTPGAVALLGLAGLTGIRRRR
ncbi:MAG: hypothetical protein ACIAQF_06525 [Phycisphaerales bacterium JB065]